jgi:hypothetical protein
MQKAIAVDSVLTCGEADEHVRLALNGASMGARMVGIPVVD